MDWLSLASPAAGCLLAPLLPGVVNRTKSFFGGRRGPPLAQAYYDLAKLLGKGAVYSRTTTWIFRAGGVLALAATLTALALVPLGGIAAPAAFPGDLLLFAGLLGLARFALVLAALDTGSAFAGLGASREVCFAALAEPALLLALGALVHQTGSWSLSGLVGGANAATWAKEATTLALAAAALFIVLLAENSRLPVDDPNTHLELTMIHEVLILDHGGVDLAFLLYAAWLKLWLFAALLVGLLVPARGQPLAAAGAFLGGMFLLAVLIGVIESTMARLRLVRVPKLLVGALALAALALALNLRGQP